MRPPVATACPPAPSLRLFPLAWPLFLEVLLGMGVGVVGTALAASLSDASGAVFALSNHVVGMLFILFRVVGAGVGVVVTQSLGGGRRDRADALALAAALASLPQLRLLNAPAEVLPLMWWLAPATLLDAWNASMASVMRATCAPAIRWSWCWSCPPPTWAWVCPE